jgi:ribosome biogenesis GTPase / thiamine phosphate phosphatase
MNFGSQKLNQLGWSDWFAQHTDCAPGDCVARVMAVDRDLLLLMDQTGTFRARLAGSYRYRHRMAHELPCVGDWVCVAKRAGDLGQVSAIVERRTELRRKSAGPSADMQMIAANVDYVIVVQSSHYDFNLKRLERYLVMVTEGGAEACVLLTKTDLVAPAIVTAQQAEIAAAGIKAPVLALSNVTRTGVDELVRMMRPGKTYCFVGSSGVGKSTLINHLVGCEQQLTKRVSGTGEGRHTTVRRELILLEGGALVIDNPGMREFGIVGATSGLDSRFGDIGAYGSKCRFRNCTHTNEPGCAVREAVEAAEVDADHYENYVKLRKESEFNELSYVERRKKDRTFGKFIKSAKKDLSSD